MSLRGGVWRTSPRLWHICSLRDNFQEVVVCKIYSIERLAATRCRCELSGIMRDMIYCVSLYHIASYHIMSYHVLVFAASARSQCAGPVNGATEDGNIIIIIIIVIIIIIIRIIVVVVIIMIIKVIIRSERERERERTPALRLASDICEDSAVLACICMLDVSCSLRARDRSACSVGEP